MLQLDTARPVPRGRVSNSWYDSIRIEDLVIEGDRITDGLHNLIDREHPPRR